MFMCLCTPTLLINNQQSTVLKRTIYSFQSYLLMSSSSNSFLVWSSRCILNSSTSTMSGFLHLCLFLQHHLIHHFISKRASSSCSGAPFLCLFLPALKLAQGRVPPQVRNRAPSPPLTPTFNPSVFSLSSPQQPSANTHLE